MALKCSKSVPTGHTPVECGRRMMRRVCVKFSGQFHAVRRPRQLVHHEHPEATARLRIRSHETRGNPLLIPSHMRRTGPGWPLRLNLRDRPPRHIGPEPKRRALCRLPQETRAAPFLERCGNGRVSVRRPLSARGERIERIHFAVRPHLWEPSLTIGPCPVG